MHEDLMAMLGKSKAQDQMDCCRSGLEDEASKRKGLWIVLSFTEDGDLSISGRPGERTDPICTISKICVRA